MYRSILASCLVFISHSKNNIFLQFWETMDVGRGCPKFAFYFDLSLIIRDTFSGNGKIVQNSTLKKNPN